MFLLSAPFVAAGIFLLLNADDRQEAIMGWINIAFFGLGVLVSFFNLFDRRPQLIINEIGIFDRNVHSDFINWEIIQRAYLVDIHRQKFICLKVMDEFKPSKKKGFFYKKMAAWNEAVGAQELNIQLGQIKIDEKKLTEFVNAMSQAAPTEKGDHIKRLSENLGES